MHSLLVHTEANTAPLGVAVKDACKSMRAGPDGSSCVADVAECSSCVRQDTVDMHAVEMVVRCY